MYQISSISLDKDGTYWVDYYGDVPEQGGIRWGRGQIGFVELDDALEFIKGTLEKNLDTYKELIRKKNCLTS